MSLLSAIRQPERGFTLLELLISMVVLVFAVLMALLMYDSGWQAYKMGENAAEQQQAVRTAFDKLTADLQMTGFNYRPDGVERPDEQVEAAFDTAIVIRADFDAQDGTLKNTPESTLDGGAYEQVSTGNDEIIVYALAKPDGSSTDTLTFEADVGEVPRDGDVETINVTNVALVQDDPPYTLYRINLSNDHTKLGTSEFFERTVLAENVYSMTFRYFNAADGQINSTFNLDSYLDDIGGDDVAADLALRDQIDRIEVDVVGLTRDPDLDWKDPGDSNPVTQAHRKFRLSSDVTPRNVGMFGVKDIEEFP